MTIIWAFNSLIFNFCPPSKLNEIVTFRFREKLQNHKKSRKKIPSWQHCNKVTKNWCLPIEKRKYLEKLKQNVLIIIMVGKCVFFCQCWVQDVFSPKLLTRFRKFNIWFSSWNFFSVNLKVKNFFEVFLYFFSKVAIKISNKAQ